MATLILSPNGDYSVQLLPYGAGSGNYGRVNESSLDTTNGVETNNDASHDLTDLYYMQDHSGQIGTISSVTIYAYIQADILWGAGDEYQIRCNGGAGSLTAIVGTTGWRSAAFSINPNTAVAWTWSDIDAMVAGERLINTYTDGGKSGAFYSNPSCAMLYAVVNYTPPSGTLFFALG